MAGKGVVRSIKNYAKGFSEVQIKVREATSNDPHGPSGVILNELAQLTFNEHDFIEIMDMLDKRLNDKGKNWRHVFKALVVLDYLLHFGSENVVMYAKENVYVIKTLREFQHLDDAGRDVGHNVRQKANEVTSLILDDQRLRDERKSPHSLQDRVWNIDYTSTALTRRNEPRYIDEERDLQRAIEESKRLAEIESKKRGDR
ncbi:ENTH-domain-containing protein [Rhizopus microsporus var. microsporus]|uniref:ENTH-domain-containing protein n=2 Tax=Rhizopus microsporus TaxID=58291 RepID=A0A2G4SKH8_RHIZD|nr:ENTH-domain-containing protein [Rhizopus microsporus ATCC 52813]ORE06277.1 ENTH-domain-containing protein [Rhizopus microsporus var. microsporus]PHZ09274.1 ENTH-domain-containing protein [Rhizopus microsporus ATCC 52813]